MSTQARRFHGLVAAALAIAAGAIPVQAQRIIAVTQTRNAQGDAFQLQASSLDFKTGAVLPGGRVLPGTVLTGPMVLDQDRTGIHVTTGQPWRGGRFDAPQQSATLTSFRGAPFDVWPGAGAPGAPGWREHAVGVFRDDLTLSYLLVTAGLRREDGAWRGQLLARPWPPEGTPDRVQAEGGAIPLAIAPRFTLALHGGRTLAIGAAGNDDPAMLQTARVTGMAAEAPVPFTSGTHPDTLHDLRGAWLSADARQVFILFSSLALAEPASWLYALDATSLRAAGPPLELPGVAAGDASCFAADLRGVWVATRAPGTDFARITRIEPDGGGVPGVIRSVSLVGVRASVVLAAEPARGNLIVAAGPRVEFWPGGLRADNSHLYDAPVTIIQWTAFGPVLGEGNRLHRVALPSCAPEATVAMRHGWVVGAVWLPEEILPAPDADADGLEDALERRLQTRPDHPDSDGDGIPDGSDPHPNAPSPRLSVSPEVVFPHTAVGRQLRALRIESAGDPDAQWEIHLDDGALPWLRVHPRTSRGTGYAYLGVDPERFDPAGITSGHLTVTLTGRAKGNRPGYTAAYSPATVLVRVDPPRSTLPRMLWIWPATGDARGVRDAEDPRGLGALVDLAAGYPCYFAIAEHFGPVSEPLDAFSIVAISARAAAEGVLTQKALFDYLSGGGAVLFLGEHLAGDHFRDLGAWLGPLGVDVPMDSPLQGAFPAAGEAELLGHWRDFPMRNGSGFVLAEDAGVSVPGPPGRHVFIARDHGYGRIALLASPAPLETRALDAPDNRAFALDLLYWLSRAGYAVEDRDGDGLPDAVEDRNGNGAVDPGETDWLNPDTDGDGLPDGAEDTNRNGRVDPGETDPRNPDTDGDGTPDGADTAPLG